MTILVFAGLMLLGDLIKLIFIKEHNFLIRDTPASTLYGLTIFYLIGYLVILVAGIF